MSFDDLGLSPEILRAVHEEGYTTPTPVQEQSIPIVLAGHDLMGRAQTGTGKTAAFALPILERLKAHANSSFSPARHPVRCLVVTPTRELAVQVERSFQAYGRHLPLADDRGLRRRADAAPGEGAARAASRSSWPRPVACSTMPTAGP